MNARTPSIDVSAEACAARAQRIEGYTVARRVRESELMLAREIYVKHRLHNDAEVLRALESIHDNCDDSPYRERLKELILDMDADFHADELELLGVDKRGEYDNRTAGVRHRSAA
jgi:hypothetical protein